MISDKFLPSSRYAGVEVVTRVEADGRTVAYLKRRFVPQPDRFALLREHVVHDGERLDQLSAAYLGDPEQFWRIADANGAIAPETMTDDAGAIVRITLPADVPAMTEEQ
jgi:hypothetical protein